MELNYKIELFLYDPSAVNFIFHFAFQNSTKVFLDISYSNLNKTLIAASADRHLRLYDPRVTGKTLCVGLHNN